MGRFTEWARRAWGSRGLLNLWGELRTIVLPDGMVLVVWRGVGVGSSVTTSSNAWTKLREVCVALTVITVGPKPPAGRECGFAALGGEGLRRSYLMHTRFFFLFLGLAAAVGEVPAFYGDKEDLMVYLDGQGAARPVRTLDDWERRKDDILANMQQVMGEAPDELGKVPLELEVLAEVDLPKYVRQTITFAVESWDRLPAYLLIPKGLDGQVPGIVCPHPTHACGKGVVVGLCGKPHRNYAHELAERGYVTLAPDYPGFGDYVATRKALYDHGYVSCTMKGIWNHRRAVDLLQSLPMVDGERIGCIGHSLGGHNTLYAGAFDRRIKVMVSSCGFNSFSKYKGGDLSGWSHDGYMPRIAAVYGKDPARMPFDFTEVLGVLAPRYVFVSAPLHDDNFEVSGVRDCMRAAVPVYGLYGAHGRLIAVHPEAGHDFPDEARERAYAFMDQAFGKQSVPVRREE